MTSYRAVSPKAGGHHRMSQDNRTARNNPGQSPDKLYTVVTLIVQYFLPLLVIAVFYLLIFRT